MIPRTETSWQSESDLSWQQQLIHAVTDPRELLRILDLDTSLAIAAETAARQFSLRVPLAFIQRMEPGMLSDPLLRQVLPIDRELIATDGFSPDPLQENSGSQQLLRSQPGLIQKYSGRVLLLINGHCAVNCRYCFRRHFAYEDNRLNRSQWQQVINQIADDSSITEVIYSGGDPLASGDQQLQWLTQQMATISHLKRLRIHTRLPVVIPARITDTCLQWLTQHRLKTVIVLHINHPNEIDAEVTSAVNKLLQAGITLLNQTVLLKGVNDRVETLTHLSEKLFDIGVLPYYLHMLDRVSGTAHFEVSNTRAKDLQRQLLSALPGYLVPRLVKEIPGATSKIPADWEAITSLN